MPDFHSMTEDEFNALTRQEQIELTWPIFEKSIKKCELALALSTQVFSLLNLEDVEIAQFLAFTKGALRAGRELEGASNPFTPDLERLYEDAGFTTTLVRAKHQAGGEN